MLCNGLHAKGGFSSTASLQPGDSHRADFGSGAEVLDTACTGISKSTLNIVVQLQLPSLSACEKGTEEAQFV